MLSICKGSWWWGWIPVWCRRQSWSWGCRYRTWDTLVAVFFLKSKLLIWIWACGYHWSLRPLERSALACISLWFRSFPASIWLSLQFFNVLLQIRPSLQILYLSSMQECQIQERFWMVLPRWMINYSTLGGFECLANWRGYRSSLVLSVCLWNSLCILRPNILYNQNPPFIG